MRLSNLRKHSACNSWYSSRSKVVTKTCSKIEKPWFLLVKWIAKSGKMSRKMITVLIYLSNNWPYIAAIPLHTAWSMINFLYYFHRKIIQKKLEIFKKRNFSGQNLDFLPPRKLGLCISRVNCFFFEYREYPVESFNTLINCRR